MSNIVVLKQGKQKIKMQKNHAISELLRAQEIREFEHEKINKSGDYAGGKYWLYNCYYYQLCKALNITVIDDIPF